jgi:hypothetical protein
MFVSDTPQRTDVMASMLSNELCDAVSPLNSWLLFSCSGNCYLQNANVDHFHHESSPLNHSVKFTISQPALSIRFDVRGYFTLYRKYGNQNWIGRQMEFCFRCNA